MTIRTDPIDPDIEWMLDGQVYYKRRKGTRNWQVIHECRLTPTRVRVIYEMLEAENQLVVEEVISNVVA